MESGHLQSPKPGRTGGGRALLLPILEPRDVRELETPRAQDLGVGERGEVAPWGPHPRARVEAGVLGGEESTRSR